MATKPSIVNIKLDTANKVYYHQLPMGGERFVVQMRDSTDLLMAVESDVLGTAVPDPQYFTVKSGTIFEQNGLDIAGDVWLYFQSAGTNKVVEIMQWS